MSKRDEASQGVEVFNALGSVVRLQILSVLQATTRPLHIKALSRGLKVDYAAMYRHVKVLESAGLVEVYEVGRSRVVEVVNAPLLKDLIEKAKVLSKNRIH